MKTIIEQSAETLTNKEKYQLLTSKVAHKMSDLTEPIMVKSWALMEDRKPDEEGVIESKLMLSVLAETGDTYVTNSPTFIDSFKEIVDIFGRTGLLIQAVKSTSKKGRTFILCEYLGD